MVKPYTKIRLLIADDHELVREGLQVLIRKAEDIEIVGEASNGEQLVQLTRKLLPEVILTDVKMPQMDGIEATRIIKEEFPHIGILGLSSFDEESLMIDMLKAGAKGYLLKNAGKQELTEAIKAAYKDEPYYCKHTNAKLAQLIASGGHGGHANEVANLFTPRELEVIELMCEGQSSKLIGDQLNLKPRTVERYRDSIMKKMQVNNATAVVMFAVKHALFNALPPKDDLSSL